MIRSLQLKRLHIPFKQSFRHAAAERAETSSLLVTAISKQGVLGYGEACPRSYVTGETLDSAQTFFERHRVQLCDQIIDLNSLSSWMHAHQQEIDANPAAWCAIELAMLDLLAKLQHKTLEAFLGLPPLKGDFHYSAVLGDAEIKIFKTILERYRQQGFKDFKIKLSGDFAHDKAKLELLGACNDSTIRIRVDANNLWRTAEQAIKFLNDLNYSFFAIEEPLAPNQHSELLKIATALNSKIILDESFLRIAQFAQLTEPFSTWIINLRVSKMGGLLRSLAIVEAARRHNIACIIGAQVGETSLLTRAGLTVAQAACEQLIAQEGAYGNFLLSEDICTPSLMFARQGVLDSVLYPELQNPGFGLSVKN